MSMSIRTNVASLNAQHALFNAGNDLQTSMQRLSSGYRINSSADDAAGMAISTKMQSQIGGLNQAAMNAQDGMSMIQTAEGALDEVTSSLQRMRDLAVQASNTGSNGTTAIAAAQAEVDQLVSAIGDIASRTKFNGTSLLATAGASSLTFQVGANSGETLSVSLKDMGVTSLGIGSLSLASASTAISALDTAISSVSTQRGSFGAAQNRLEHTISNLSVTQENLAASESRIRDTDMASEMTEFSKSQILMQAGTAMLAQANSAPQNILSLLRG